MGDPAPLIGAHWLVAVVLLTFESLIAQNVQRLILACSTEWILADF